MDLIIGPNAHRETVCRGVCILFLRHNIMETETKQTFTIDDNGRIVINYNNGRSINNEIQKQNLRGEFTCDAWDMKKIQAMFSNEIFFYGSYGDSCWNSLNFMYRGSLDELASKFEEAQEKLKKSICDYERKKDELHELYKELKNASLLKRIFKWWSIIDNFENKIHQR